MKTFAIFLDEPRVHYCTFLEAHDEDEAFLIYFNNNGDYDKKNYDKQFKYYKKSTCVLEIDLLKYEDGKEFLVPLEDE